MERRILKFNPRIEDIPKELTKDMSRTFEYYDVDDIRYFSKIVKIFLKNLIRAKGLNAVVISEPYWLETFGWYAIDAVEKVAYNCGLEFWTIQSDSDEFSYYVLKNGYPDEIKDYRNMFVSLENWEKNL
ncbi:MAG: hypothetical protein IKF52_07180 [Clostridia bacterium]|nr:hypothetical protein [Clostridia bacterium]